MRANWTNIRNAMRSLTAVSAATLLGMALCLTGSPARAQSVPSVVMSQPLGTVGTGGGIFAGANPAGTSMGVNSNGDLIVSNTYGNDVELFSHAGWTQSPVPAPTVIATASSLNPAGVAVDKQNNLYIGFAYNGYIVKLPYVGGTTNGGYAAFSAPGSSTPACTGSDTAECLETNANTGNNTATLAFDAAGDLFISTVNGATASDAIFECTTACLNGGSTAAAQIFQEPTATAQLFIGEMSFDVGGNLFFTDSATNSSDDSTVSNLKELPYSSGAYASTPITLYTYTPATPGNYDNQIDGVAVGPNGVVYLGIETGGILGFPDTNGAVSSYYFVSNQTAKSLAVDSSGNLYVAYYSGTVGGDAVTEVELNPLFAPATTQGSATSSTFTTILNDGTACASTPTVTYSFTGSSASAYSAATTGTCSSVSVSGGAAGSGVTGTATSAALSATLTFTPSIGGVSSAVITATDNAGNTGNSNVGSSSTGTLATPTFSPDGGAFGSVQSVTITSASGGASIYYTTDGSTPSASSTLYTGPVTVSSSETINAIAIESGDTNSGVGTATFSVNLAPAGPPAFTPPAGTYMSAQQVTITTSTPGAVIYYTTDGSTPTEDSAVYSGPITVATSETINAFAKAPGAIASGVVSAAYTINLPASAFQNVVITQLTTMGALTGGNTQSGTVPASATLGVNSAGDVLVANTYGHDVQVFAPGSSTPSVWNFGGNLNPAGVAVDNNGNAFVGFSYSSQVIKVPYVNGTYATVTPSTSYSPAATGTPNCSGNDTVECIMTNVTGGGSGAVSMVFDANGDLFYSTNNANQYQPTASPNAIYECTAACLYSTSGTPASVLLYQEPTGTTSQLNIGGMAVDSSNDLFFTDSAISSTVSQESLSSNLNELPVSSSSATGYAATPSPIYTYTPSATAQYGAELDGVAVSSNGTLYAALEGAGSGQAADPGIIAVPLVSGKYKSTNMYLAAPTNAKVLGSDKMGNLYLSDDGGNVDELTVGNVTVPTAPAGGTATTATDVTTVLNDAACSASPTVTFAASGTNASAFSAATSGACSAGNLTNTAAFPTTVTFAPATGDTGINTALLTATDSAGNTGTAVVTATSTGTLPAPTFSPAAGTYTAIQTVTISDASDGAQIYYTTDGSTPTTSSTLYTGPISVISSETINAIAVEAGDTTSAVASAAYVLNLPATATPLLSEPSGTYGAPQAISITDATPDATIYYTTDGTQPTQSSAVYTSPIPVTGTETISAIAASPGAVNSDMATASYTITLAPSAYQAVVMNQTTQLGTLTAGNSQSGTVPDGATVGANSLGYALAATTYGHDVDVFIPGSATPVVWNFGGNLNPAGVAVDSNNNAFVGFSYSGQVIKVPFVNGAYVSVTPSTSYSPAASGTPNCTGNDTVECIMTNVTGGGSGAVSMAFDSKGDLFYSTNNAAQYQPTGSPNAIYECSAACLYSGSPASVLLYQEPTGTTSQLNIGGLAVDTAGNIFFTDSAISSTVSQESLSSDVEELPVSSGTGTGYASSPTTIYTLTPSAVAQYGAELDGVAVAANGTVYASFEGAGGTQAQVPGIIGIPLVSGAYSSSSSYLVASNNAKAMGSDVFGNLFIADDSGNVYEISVDNITVPGTQVATPASSATNIYTITNDTACSGSPAITFTTGGTDASAFTAMTTGTCSSVGTSSGQFATTVTFNPTSPGGNTATLTATDSNGGTGTAEVSSTALPATNAIAPSFSPAPGPYTSAQNVTLSTTTPNATIYYTTDGSTPGTTAGGSTMVYSSPIAVTSPGITTINAIATAPNVATSPVATGVYTLTLPSATPSFSPTAGTYTAAQTVTITSSTPNAQIFYTTDGSTPAAAAGGSTMAYTGPITVSMSETVEAIATATGYSSSPVGIAVYAINLPPAATPTFSPAAGTYTSVQTVSISDATPNATIYYTVDGTTPSANGGGSTQTYTGPITVGANEIVNAIAVASGYSTSDLGTASYVINLPQPTFTLTAKTGVLNVTPGGNGTVTLTIVTNETFTGTISVQCQGYLPQGSTCTASPAALTPGPSATATSTLTVSIPSNIAAIPGESGPLFAGTLLAGVVALLGLRKRRRLQVLLLFIIGFAGFGMLSGCGNSEHATPPTSSQVVVTASTPQTQTQAAITQTVPIVVEY